MENIVVFSPNGSHTANLLYSGEIRFGPPYYSLTIDELSFKNRVFGRSCLWSPDSRFFAVQEWESTNEGQGPKTRLLSIDVEQKRECVLSRAEQGFIIPKKFEGDKLVYTKEYPGKGIVNEFEIAFLTLNRWEDLK